MELFVDPPMYGRADAGHSVTAATHQPADNNSAAPPANSCKTRARSRGRPAHRYTPANTGSTMNACSILVSNASPSSTPHSTSPRVRPVSIADHSAQADASSNNVSKASGLLYRNMTTATGVTASASAARWAATSPAHLRTSRCRISTDATPATASGSRMLHELKPNTRADNACTQKAAGGLSTVMNDPGSMAPKKNAFQLTVPAFTAAA